MRNNAHPEATLVLGGTGKTGRRVVERLRARGLPVRVGSRSGEPPFDWEERSTWAPALDGVGSVYLTYYPDLAVPGAVEAASSFAELAVRSGVPRLALLSGRGEPEAERAEQAVRDTGADLTILRSTWFMQNFSEDYMLEHVLSGEIRLPTGEVPTPFVDADDIADVAVAALTEDGHAGQLYELTGPRSLTFAHAAAEIAEATGREVRYVPVSLPGSGPPKTPSARPRDDAGRAARGPPRSPSLSGAGRDADELPRRVAQARHDCHRSSGRRPLQPDFPTWPPRAGVQPRTDAVQDRGRSPRGYRKEKADATYASQSASDSAAA